MFEKELSKIEINGIEYPYKCDMVVLEKIQKEYGDIVEFEQAIMGVIPYYDENGVRDNEKDQFTVPDVGKVCNSLIWMIEEGIEISEVDLEVPDVKFIMRQEDLSINELALLAFGEYGKCFLSKKSENKKMLSQKTDSGKKKPGKE